MPDFLVDLYRPEALDNVGSTLAAVDARGTILWVNQAWHQFARDNGGQVDGCRSYLDGMAEPLRSVYREILETVLATGEVFEQDYECSSATTIRRFRLRVLPFPPAGLLLEHTPVASHPAPIGEPAIEALYLDENGYILQCSNCRRIRRPALPTESWVWIRDWVAHLHPRMTHGLCTACAGYYYRRRRRAR
ncbi:MAG TPA: PAS domain-containing protein [Kofleriaceae bacterium]|nr:PAS domain-containing protein [Kofleriaceae bacterium]